MSYLILSRKPNESIHIGEDIVIKIEAVQGNQVKVGINAPENVRIRRSELLPRDIDVEGNK